MVSLYIHRNSYSMRTQKWHVLLWSDMPFLGPHTVQLHYSYNSFLKHKNGLSLFVNRLFVHFLKEIRLTFAVFFSVNVIYIHRHNIYISLFPQERGFKQEKRFHFSVKNVRYKYWYEWIWIWKWLSPWVDFRSK